ncbi:MAG: amidase [Gemmatimonadaceae bacterium]
MSEGPRDGVSRRDFGRLLGAAALRGMLPNAETGTSNAMASAHAASLPLPDASDELCDLTAVELAARIRRKQLSAYEVMAAHLARIERTNAKVNAIVTLVAERAIADARRADEHQARGGTLGPLHGLPMAHKDLVATAGIRTTYGSTLWRENVPTTDALVVQRVRAAGAITVGKTNTPEWGAGSNTFNAVFGATVNPYDLTKTVGGSSGGAAAALRCGMVPIAGGSDTGGSLRNPAAFTNVVGMRPSPGRVPDDDGSWSPLSTQGPMARTVADVALLLSAMAGPYAPDPLALDDDGASFRAPLDRSFKGARVAWFTSMGGIPFEPEITRVVNANRQVFSQLGCEVHDDEPDFAGVDDAFPILRHIPYHANFASAAREHPDAFKDTIKWEIAEAQRMTGADVSRATARQAHLYTEMARFFERYDYFIAPVTQVEPFDVKTEYPTNVAGVPMPTYIDWMRSCWYVTLTACPAISVPAGFTARGLPVGLQIVGPHRGDWRVLQIAHAFEQATLYGRKKPGML